jgi:cyclopropane fatty-acyl-phospholipid synthase-like methyltransferase
LEEAGLIRGSVLDGGCGTGENALYLASRGHEVWGLDFVPVAIERATAKAKERGLDAHFQVGDALMLDQLGRSFDTVINCGLFHTFGDEERPLYASGLATVVRPGGSVHILCFSDPEPPGQGPRLLELVEPFLFSDDLTPHRVESRITALIEVTGMLVSIPASFLTTR